jgi:hypothetical protein
MDNLTYEGELIGYVQQNFHYRTIYFLLKLRN